MGKLLHERFDWPKADLSPLKEMQTYGEPKSVGRPAPPLDASHWINAGPLDWTKLRGKVVLIDFTALGVRQKIIPGLRKLVEAYGPAGLEVISIFSPRDTPDDVRQFVRELQVSHPVAIDRPHEGEYGSTRAAFGMKSEVSSFLVDRVGIVHAVTRGRLIDESRPPAPGANRRGDRAALPGESRVLGRDQPGGRAGLAGLGRPGPEHREDRRRGRGRGRPADRRRRDSCHPGDTGLDGVDFPLRGWIEDSRGRHLRIRWQLHPAGTLQGQLHPPGHGAGVRDRGSPCLDRPESRNDLDPDRPGSVRHHLGPGRRPGGSTGRRRTRQSSRITG